jgi:hypothetical protein
MRNGFYLLALVITAALPTVAADTKTDIKAIATQLIQDAETKSEIFALPSFDMQGTAHIVSKGKPMDGTYRLMWNGPDQWREEIRFPDYTEERIGSKGSLWTQRSTGAMPYPIYKFRSALGFGSDPHFGGWFFHLAPRDNETVKKSKVRRKVESSVNASILSLLKPVTGEFVLAIRLAR